MIVIGLAGRIGAGKGEVASYLKRKYGAQQFVYSDILTHILKRLHMPVTRENLQKLGEGLRGKLGSDVLVNAMRGDLAVGTAELRLVDGVRYVNEVRMLREFPKNKLIFIDAPFELRYERVTKRAEKGEADMTMKQFKERAKAATEKELDRVKDLADFVVNNTGSQEELHKRIDKIMCMSR